MNMKSKKEVSEDAAIAVFINGGKTEVRLENGTAVFTSPAVNQIKYLILNYNQVWFCGKDIAASFGLESQEESVINCVGENDRMLFDRELFINGCGACHIALQAVANVLNTEGLMQQIYNPIEAICGSLQHSIHLRANLDADEPKFTVELEYSRLHQYSHPKSRARCGNER